MKEEQIEDKLTNNIEYLIDNNSFFEEIQIHTCSLKVEQIIDYRLKNKLSINKLLENTINRYKDNIQEEKRLYELDEDYNSLYSKKRYQNYISSKKIEELKLRFINSNLHHLETVITSIIHPYLNKFFHFLNSINHSLYVKKVQFNNSSTQYTNDNYKNKTDAMKEEAESFNNQNNLDDAKIHRGILDTIKEDNIEGSVILSSITNQLLFKVFEISSNDEFDEKDINTIKRNQQLDKRIEKVNFTELEMYNGFAQACYWNYSQSDFKTYKIHRKTFNKKRTNKIPYIRKDMIANDVLELFNLALDKDKIIQIRQSLKTPTILKMYDDIYIYTTKDVTQIDNQFYDFMIEHIFDKTPKIKNFIKENEQELRKYIKSLRILFY